MRRSDLRAEVEVAPGKTKPAASTRSVGGIKACALEVRLVGEVSPSEVGNMNPRLLSNGLRESGAKREFHIRLGKKALLMTSACDAGCVAHSPRADNELLSTPIAID